LKAWLSQKDIQYTERNIAEDETALDELKNMGVFSTPATLIDGDLVLGFDQKKLEELLGFTKDT